jgi:hypothetical protein
MSRSLITTMESGAGFSAPEKRKPPLPPSPLAERPLARMPEWLQGMSRAIAATTYSDHTRETYLDVLPTDEQHTMIEAARNQLVDQLEQTPRNCPELEPDMLDAIGALMLSKPHSADSGALKAEATIRSFRDDLKDIPTWATLRALENWRKGQCESYSDPKDKYDYRWMPQSYELLEIAKRYTRDVRERIQEFDDVLFAVKRGEKPNVQKLPPPSHEGGFKHLDEIKIEI